MKKAAECSINSHRSPSGTSEIPKEQISLVFDRLRSSVSFTTLNKIQNFDFCSFNYHDEPINR